MNKSLYYSVFLHMIIILICITGVPTLRRVHKQEDTIITEIIPISEITNVKVKPVVKEQPQKQEVPKAPEKIIIPPIAKSQETKEEIGIKEDKKRPQKKDDFANSILKSLETNKNNFSDVEKALSGQTTTEYKAHMPMSLSEIDNIKSQISKSWNTAAFQGAAEKKLEVFVKIELDIAGNVIKVTPKKANNTSPYYRVFVESTLRAVQAASPLQGLSKDKYSHWKEIELRFDTTGMIY